MTRMLKPLLLILFFIGFTAILTFFLPQNLGFLNAKGFIALQERSLFITAIILSLIAIVPVLLFTVYTTWRYRESNSDADYNPDAPTNHIVRGGWWGVFCVIVTILAVITWNSTHALDPFKPIQASTSTKPITIQVVALQWKWLFIYPEENIATVNFIAFPEKTPVTFELTADAPMNSFWIPQLAGQMYAMEGMVNKLHVIADHTGEFPGLSAEISGEGFAGMRFIAKATTQEEFTAWVQSVKASESTLLLPTYTTLAKPSENNPRMLYGSVEKDLYKRIVMKHMPSNESSEDVLPAMTGMEH